MLVQSLAATGVPAVLTTASGPRTAVMAERADTTRP